MLTNHESDDDWEKSIYELMRRRDYKVLGDGSGQLMRFWWVKNVRCAIERTSMNKCRKNHSQDGKPIIRVDELKSDTD